MRFRRSLHALPGLLLLASAGSPAATPPHEPESSIDVPLESRALARERIVATAHGRELRCEGVPLVALLRQAGAMPREPLRGAPLAARVEVGARDGYRVVFALAELDPATGPTRALLVDRCDGRALQADDGPLRLIVPSDVRPARWIRQIESIRVVGPRPRATHDAAPSTHPAGHP